MKVNLWKNGPPNITDLTNYLSGEKAQVLLEKMTGVISDGIDWMWAEVPANVESLVFGGGFVGKKTNKIDFLQNIMMTVFGSNTPLDSPYQIAAKFLSTFKATYGVCPRRYHSMFVSTLYGKQPCLELPEKARSFFAAAPMIMRHFKKQVYLCTEHRHATCNDCENKFDLLEQEPKYWIVNTPACSSCLKNQLMFVERHHSPRSLVVTNNKGRRTIYRTKFGSVPQLQVPVGVPAETIAQATQQQQQPPSPHTNILSQAMQQFLMNTQASLTTLSPEPIQPSAVIYASHQAPEIEWQSLPTWTPYDDDDNN